MTRFNEVRAGRFVLEDGSGHARAVLGVDAPTGAVSLRLVGAGEETVFELTTVPGGAALMLRDEYGNERVLISAGHGGASVTLNDLGGNPAVTLSVGPGPQRSIGLFLDGATAAWGKEVTGDPDETIVTLGPMSRGESPP